MGLCLASFLGMFTFAFGISLMVVLPNSMSIVIEKMIPLPMGIMVVGFLVALISLLIIRSMGSFLCDIDSKTLADIFKATAWLGFLVALAMCAIQLYLRFTYNEWGFFTNGELLKDALRTKNLENTNFLLLFINTAASFFLGLPFYIMLFAGGDFREYVTVTRTHLSDGSSYESHRSEAFVGVWQFILMGALLILPFLALSNSLLVYLFAAGYGVLLFGVKDKKSLITAIIVFGVLALGLTVLTLLPNLGVQY